MLSFMPVAGRVLDGELKLPQHRDLVVRQNSGGARRASRSILSRSRGASRADCRECSANQFSPANRRRERERLAAAIEERGVDFVGQEVVQLSTTPVWADGRCAAPVRSARVCCRDAEWLEVMPGGFCRISEHPTRAPIACAKACARPTSGCCRTAGCSRDAAAGERHVSHPALAGIAEPRRRQSVLARPLSGARRGDAAGGACLWTRRGTERVRIRGAPRRALTRVLVTWGAYRKAGGRVDGHRASALRTGMPRLGAGACAWRATAASVIRERISVDASQVSTA